MDSKLTFQGTTLILERPMLPWVCHASCVVRRVSCVVRHAPCVVCRASCVVRRVSCVVRHAPCVVCRASCVVYRVSCVMCHVSCFTSMSYVSCARQIMLFQPHHVVKLNMLCKRCVMAYNTAFEQEARPRTLHTPIKHQIIRNVCKLSLLLSAFIYATCPSYLVLYMQMLQARGGGAHGRTGTNASTGTEEESFAKGPPQQGGLHVPG